MTRYWKTLIIVLALQLTLPASAKMDDDVMVHNASARATFALATTAAVYLTLMNHSDHTAVLTGVSVAKEIASEAQIHTTVMDGDMMKMRQVTNGIDILPGAMLEFKSGSYHIMLMGLKNPLEQGNKFSLTLHFADKTAKTVDVIVGTQSEQGAHHHH